MREALEENDSISIGGTRVPNLRCADDTVLIAEDPTKLQSMTEFSIFQNNIDYSSIRTERKCYHR